MRRSRREPVSRSSSSPRPTREAAPTRLLLSPPDAIAPGFGPASLERHLRAAEAAGASTQLVVDAALGFDLDTPDDLALLGPDRLAELMRPSPPRATTVR